MSPSQKCQGSCTKEHKYSLIRDEDLESAMFPATSRLPNVKRFLAGVFFSKTTVLLMFISVFAKFWGWETHRTHEAVLEYRT